MKKPAAYLTGLTMALTVALSAPFASAEMTGLFVEPGLSYQITQSNVDFTDTYGNSNVTNRGFGVVGRLGFHVYERFFVAADARYALLSYNDNANNASASATSWDIAPVIGVQMADYGVRLFGGYIMAGSLDPDSSNGFDLKYDEGTGWRAGMGIKLQAVSVNVEWQRISYGRSEFKGPGVTANASAEYDADGLVASVSFPFEFE